MRFAGLVQHLVDNTVIANINTFQACSASFRECSALSHTLASLSPSRLVPNSWHFDIRYVHLEPTPSHILFFLQDASEFSHLKSFPIGLATRSSRIKFFPDTPGEAAPEVAKALMHAFVKQSLHGI